MTRTRNGAPTSPKVTAPEDPAARVLFDVERSAGERRLTPAQVRRRRAAADRCPPLDDGRRDPLEPEPDRWTFERVLHVEVGRRIARLHGGRMVRLLDQADVERRQWDHRRRLWMVSGDQVDDLLVYAEHTERRFVTVEAVQP